MRSLATNLKMFIVFNDLKKSELSEYLGFKSPFLSQILSGEKKLPEEHLAKIINNDRGWDVSMLTQDNEKCHEEELSKLREMYDGLLRERDEKIRALEMELCQLKIKLNNK